MMGFRLSSELGASGILIPLHIHSRKNQFEAYEPCSAFAQLVLFFGTSSLLYANPSVDVLLQDLRFHQSNLTSPYG
jgi:hypothetical protein